MANTIMNNKKRDLHTTMMAILPPTSPTTVIGGFSLGISTGQNKNTHKNLHQILNSRSLPFKHQDPHATNKFASCFVRRSAIIYSRNICKNLSCARHQGALSEEEKQSPCPYGDSRLDVDRREQMIIHMPPLLR